ncbi:hypothetical protein DFP73DRAFT_244225 [Morchella snyderi]|nr:hypothetical protein DFP73DRAFT_244225 [Morchella snyderi]
MCFDLVVTCSLVSASLGPAITALTHNSHSAHPTRILTRPSSSSPNCHSSRHHSPSPTTHHLSHTHTHTHAYHPTPQPRHPPCPCTLLQHHCRRHHQHPRRRRRRRVLCFTQPTHATRRAHLQPRAAHRQHLVGARPRCGSAAHNCHRHRDGPLPPVPSITSRYPQRAEILARLWRRDGMGTGDVSRGRPDG